MIIIGKRTDGANLMSNKPSKQELIKQLQRTRQPILETFEVFARDDKKEIMKSIDNNMRYGHFRVIILRER